MMKSKSILKLNNLIALMTSITAGVVAFSASAGAVTTVSNSIYQINVESQLSGNSSQFGSWNAITSTGHPTGAGNDILYDQNVTQTNFSSLRIFDQAGSRDYTFGGRGGGISLDSFLTSEGNSPFVPAGQGFRTTWNLTPENLGITQDVVIVGSTFNNSAIYHSVQLTNTGTSPISLGWRNLYDWAVNDPGFDDGPNNQVETLGGSTPMPATTNEFSYVSTGNDFVRVSLDSPTATYQPLLALGFDPGFLAALPTTRPTEYAYVSWPISIGTAFDYTVNTGRNVSSDSAGLSWFGRDAASAHTVAPGQSIGSGQSVRFTQVLFGVRPGEEPPQSVPEPTSTLGLLALGAMGATSALKRKNGQNTQDNNLN